MHYVQCKISEHMALCASCALKWLEPGEKFCPAHRLLSSLSSQRLSIPCVLHPSGQSVHVAKSPGHEANSSRAVCCLRSDVPQNSSRSSAGTRCALFSALFPYARYIVGGITQKKLRQEKMMNKRPDTSQKLKNFVIDACGRCVA